jgi:hypothetical protein
MEGTTRRNNRNKEKHSHRRFTKAITDPNELTNLFPDNAMLAFASWIN